jgi:hypothetical protein
VLCALLCRCILSLSVLAAVLQVIRGNSIITIEALEPIY